MVSVKGEGLPNQLRESAPKNVTNFSEENYHGWPQRCDYTVDKKQVNACVLKHLFLEGVEQPKILPKNPGNALSNALLMSRFQNFKNKTALRTVF